MTAIFRSIRLISRDRRVEAGNHRYRDVPPLVIDRMASDLGVKA
jgi:hypothetical protein